MADLEGVLGVGVFFSKLGVLFGVEGSSEVELLYCVVILTMLSNVLHKLDVILGDSSGHTDENEGDKGLLLIVYLFNYY